MEDARIERPLCVSLPSTATAPIHLSENMCIGGMLLMYSSSIIIVFLRRSDPQGRIEERARERAARLMARFRPAHPQQMRKQNLSLLSRSLCFVNKRLTSSSPLLSSSPFAPRGPPRGKAEPCSCGCTAVPLADEESARGREGERERESFVFRMDSISQRK